MRKKETMDIEMRGKREIERTRMRDGIVDKERSQERKFEKETK